MLAIDNIESGSEILEFRMHITIAAGNPNIL